MSSHFVGRRRLPLYQCEATGYRFFHPPSLAGEAAFYDRFWELENPTVHRPQGGWRDDWQFALEQIRAGDRVLDVGCAEGAFLERANSITPTTGIDGNAEGCRLAKARGLNVTCSSVIEYSRLHAGEFDVVVASQVLEHVYDVRTFIESLKSLLRSESRIIISVPNNQPYFAGWSKYDPLNNPPHHIGLWNESSLRRMAEHMGLAVDAVAYLGKPDRLPVRLFRRASYLANIAKAPNQLGALDWAKLAITGAPAALLTLIDGQSAPTSSHAFMSIVLRRIENVGCSDVR